MAERQLQRALHEAVAGQCVDRRQVMAGHQLSVDKYMVVLRLAITQLFQVGANQIVAGRLVPAAGQSVQPGTIHQLGGGDVVQEVQGLVELMQIGLLDMIGAQRLYGSYPVRGYSFRAVAAEKIQQKAQAQGLRQPRAGGQDDKGCAEDAPE